MRIRKFQAANMREALSTLKAELGPDAMVVSTRNIRRGLRGAGVEVTAAVDSVEPKLSLASAYAASSAPAEPDLPPRRSRLDAGDVNRIMTPLRSELRSLRNLIRTTAESQTAESLRTELAALRQAVAGVGASSDSGECEALDHVAARFAVAQQSTARVVALVGPTGVGKTTTIAKLAGNDALVDGKHVSLISLDNYRVGGEEQMRIFADIIGVPLLMADSRARLGELIRACGTSDRIYIDTAGRSPRDVEAYRKLSATLHGIPDLEVHLTLPVNSSAQTIDACFNIHEELGVDRLLFTKLDEAHELTQLVYAPDRLQRGISWVTTGQRIPEDIETVDRSRLLELARSGFTPISAAA